MNIRETLELAAKACGYIIDYDVTPRTNVENDFYINGIGSWNPLKSSGNCADMEDALGIDVTWNTYARDSKRWGVQSKVWAKDDTVCTKFAEFADHNNDKGAAHRYASTIVAAEVGRRMK